MRVVIAAPWSAARSHLRVWLRRQPDIHLVGEAPNGLAALRLIERTSPDLAFLHVGLRGLDGIGVIDSLSTRGSRPSVVLMSPGPGDAVRAFRAQALDYLVIPIDEGRLQRSVDRARQQFRTKPSLRVPAQGDVADRRIAFRDRGRVVMMGVGDLLWIRAQRNRSEVHGREGVIGVDSALGAIEGRLPREAFVRINRSVLVRGTYIREVRPKSHGDAWVVFEDGTQEVLTRQRRQAVLRILGWPG